MVKNFCQEAMLGESGGEQLGPFLFNKGFFSCREGAAEFSQDDLNRCPFIYPAVSVQIKSVDNYIK